MKLLSILVAALMLQGFAQVQQKASEKTLPSVSPKEAKKEEKIESRFVGRVKWVKMEGTWEGKAVPIGFDAHFLVAVDILAIEKEAKLFDKKGQVVLLVHSPSHLFAGYVGEPIGRKLSFKVEGVLREGKPDYTHAQAEDYIKPEENIPIKINDGVIITPEQIETAKQIAKNVYDAEVDAIVIGQIGHVGMGAKFYFEDETSGTFVVNRSLAVMFDYEKREKNDAVERVVIDGTFRTSKLQTFVRRVFPLKKTSVQLFLPDDLTYDQVEALLTAIEGQTFKVGEEQSEVEETISGVTRRYIDRWPLSYEKIDLSKIRYLYFDKNNKTIEVRTLEERSGGNWYSFKILPNGFELVESGGWSGSGDY